MIIDTNVYLSRWPCRRLPHDETPQLVAKLRESNVAQAWVSNFDALLHKDIASVNSRLADECRQHDAELLVPIGAVNPTLPDWQDDVRRCREIHGMRGLRLHPNYHGYTLKDPRFAELLELASEHSLMVQIAVKMEDERTQHPLLRVQDVDVEPLLDLAAKYPKLPIVLLNSLRTVRSDVLDGLVSAGNVYVEHSMLEGVGGVARLLKTLPVERLLFGSYFPFFYFESALLKLRESELANFQIAAISRNNASQLWAGVSDKISDD